MRSWHVKYERQVLSVLMAKSNVTGDSMNPIRSLSCSPDISPIFPNETKSVVLTCRLIRWADLPGGLEVVLCN